MSININNPYVPNSFDKLAIFFWNILRDQFIFTHWLNKQAVLTLHGVDLPSSQLHFSSTLFSQ